MQVCNDRSPQHRYCLRLNSHGSESMYENRQGFDSLSEDDNHESELKPCLEPSFEIGHCDFGTISNFNCAISDPEPSAVRLCRHSFVDSIRADYFTEDNFKCSSETLNLEQNISDTQEIYQTIESCMKQETSKTLTQHHLIPQDNDN